MDRCEEGYGYGHRHRDRDMDIDNFNGQKTKRVLPFSEL
jgi:hypothetical protein